MKLQLVVRRVPMAAGFDWLKQAWQLFKLQPGLMIQITFILSISLVVLLSIHPVLSMLVIFIMPFISAGFYSMVAAMQQQQKVELSMLWQPLQQPEFRPVFIRLAALNLLCGLPQTWLAEILLPQLQLQQVDLPLVFLLVVLVCLNFMLFAFAVPIIYFLREKRLWPVLQASLMACWRNAGALTVYGVLSTVLLFTGPFTLLLSYLIVLPLLAIAFFIAFSDLFVLTPVPTNEDSVFEV